MRKKLKERDRKATESELITETQKNTEKMGSIYENDEATEFKTPGTVDKEDKKIKKKPIKMKITT